MQALTLQTLSLLARAAKDRRRSVPAPAKILASALRRLGLTAEYRDESIGPGDRLRLLHEVRLLARAWLKREAERARAAIDAETESKSLFGKARESAEAFFGKAKSFIKNAVVAGGLAFMGPGGPTKVETEILNRAVAEQHAYLEQFEREVVQAAAKLDPARAEMYGASVWAAAQNARRAEMVARGRGYERRAHRGADEACAVCADSIARGWVPVGTLPGLGDCAGLVNCHCDFEYRETPPAKRLRWPGRPVSEHNHDPATGQFSGGSPTGHALHREERRGNLGERPSRQTLLAKNCGTGAGGFQPGNQCQRGAGEGSRTWARATAYRRRRRKIRGEKHRVLVQRINEHRTRLARRIKKERATLVRQQARELVQWERKKERQNLRLERSQERDRQRYINDDDLARMHNDDRRYLAREQHRDEENLIAGHAIDRRQQRHFHQVDAQMARQQHRETETRLLRQRLTRRHELRAEQGE